MTGGQCWASGGWAVCSSSSGLKPAGLMAEPELPAGSRKSALLSNKGKMLIADIVVGTLGSSTNAKSNSPTPPPPPTHTKSAQHKRGESPRKREHQTSYFHHEKYLWLI